MTKAAGILSQVSGGDAYLEFYFSPSVVAVFVPLTFSFLEIRDDYWSPSNPANGKYRSPKNQPKKNLKLKREHDGQEDSADEQDLRDPKKLRKAEPSKSPAKPGPSNPKAV